MNSGTRSYKETEQITDWQDAFLRQYQSASIGTLFQGILHNLNGVSQAFTLQTALLLSTFQKADQMLDLIKDRCGASALPAVHELQDLLSQRAEVTQQIEGKITEGQDILKRVLPLTNLYESFFDSLVSVNRILQSEVTLLCAHSFFKHGVEKQLILQEDIPPLKHSFQDIHLAFYGVIQNAIEALDGCSNPSLTITSTLDGDQIVVMVKNTCLSPPHLSRDVFLPFYSTKEGHLGVGLYVAQYYLKKIGGEIDLFHSKLETCCRVSFPVHKD